MNLPILHSDFKMIIIELKEIDLFLIRFTSSSTKFFIQFVRISWLKMKARNAAFIKTLQEVLTHITYVLQDGYY